MVLDSHGEVSRAVSLACLDLPIREGQTGMAVLSFLLFSNDIGRELQLWTPAGQRRLADIIFNNIVS